VEARTPALQVAARLDGWERQWDDLVDRSPLPSPFLRSWWLQGTGGPRSLFLLVVEDGRLLGGLALDQGRRFGLPSLHLMGSRGRLCPDHLDLLAAVGDEDRTIRALRAWLCRPGSRLFDLRGVRSGSRLDAALPGPARSRPDGTAPWVQLTGGPDAFLDGLPSSFRRNVRRATGRLSAAGLTHRAIRGPSAVRSLETLRSLHQVQWGSRSQFLPDFERFATGFRGGAEDDEVVVHELASDTEVVALVVAFEVAGRVSLYQSARRLDDQWRDAATVLLTAVIVDAGTRGFTEVDFLRGDEPYKARYGPDRRPMVRLLAGNGIGGRLVAWSIATASRARGRAERWVGAVRRRPGLSS
jgi:CelD/BcsL family acetyltransferase involved in cellulose biosynthesis